MSKNNNKKSMLLVAAIFILPVILAKFALELDWFNKAATNKGELLDPVLDMSALYSTEPPQVWRILYTLPANCDDACQNAIYSVNQVWTALGKESDRAQPVIIVTEQSDAQARAQLSKLPNLTLLESDVDTVSSVFNSASQYIYIADTLQNVILRYPLHQQQQEAVLHSREILADVKKLLKLSRIG
ncbi:hypothetical protein QX776_11320 [Alteromonadaceae bacterium BrNp21-10]|nr:hypothetical protein [Alteromonadaceae bacterium BrNp21-10]